MIQSIAVGIVAGYGVLSLVGGTMGYVKAKSRASLIAGGVSGLVLLGSALLATSNPVAGFAIACVVSIALVARFAKSAIAKRAPVALVMIGGGLAVLVTAGLALA
ncbi:MAG TPA: TMEM14 family protein [Polyangiaceae bacterium]|nr:TMEM14 family protein [Polyangiaceae bacterium]